MSAMCSIFRGIDENEKVEKIDSKRIWLENVVALSNHTLILVMCRIFTNRVLKMHNPVATKVTSIEFLAENMKLSPAISPAIFSKMSMDTFRT